MNHSDTDLQLLRDIVFGDPALQARLFATEDPERFLNMVADLATSHGLSLTREDLHAALSRGQREWIERYVP
jgi:hypothetical protein